MTGKNENSERGTDEDRAHDVVVIGGGAAGLSAALVLARARRRVAVVDEGSPRNAPASHMHGFLSRDGMPPRELLARGREEIAGYGAVLLDARVARVENEGPVFRIGLVGGSTLKTRRVLFATGLRDEIPALPGLRERWGRDVLHCPYCHGYEVRDQPIGVLGNPEGHMPGLSVHQALLVRQWSHDVVLFAHTLTLSAQEREQLEARGVRVVEGVVDRLVAEGDGTRLTGVRLADGTVVERTAVFVGPRFVPHDSLLTALGCATGDDGWPSVDESGRTSVPGVWAVGNVTDPRMQVITAAGAGSTAAIALNVDLLHEEVARAVEERRTDRP
ncbi:NAD(P)/FAD-dependent oxidoreductase [Streptomyces zaomyceticus]|uniref:NAD(P)/FAD-dependent oxidoreductase n=1 Tax=Streptomyces zaomyceticus TaxID=68286 RepID=UPI003687CBA2